MRLQFLANPSQPFTKNTRIAALPIDGKPRPEAPPGHAIRGAPRESLEPNQLQHLLRTFAQTTVGFNAKGTELLPLALGIGAILFFLIFF